MNLHVTTLRLWLCFDLFEPDCASDAKCNWSQRFAMICLLVGQALKFIECQETSFNSGSVGQSSSGRGTVSVESRALGSCLTRSIHMATSQGHPKTGWIYTHLKKSMDPWSVRRSDSSNWLVLGMGIVSRVQIIWGPCKLSEKLVGAESMTSCHFAIPGSFRR